jgi:hypothetical protein
LASELDYVNKKLRYTLPAQMLFAGTAEQLRFSLKLDVQTTSTITDITCLSHAEAELWSEQTQARVALPAASLEPRDFVLELGVLCLAEPIVLTEYNAHTDSYAVLLSFLPELDEAELKAVNSEFVFIIDRSGSMGGSRMRQAVRTLMDILKLLPASIYFNVVSFGGSHKLLFPSSQPLTLEHRTRALLHVAGMKASMGGTDILQPLVEVSSADLAGRDRGQRGRGSVHVCDATHAGGGGVCLGWVWGGCGVGWV